MAVFNAYNSTLFVKAIRITLYFSLFFIFNVFNVVVTRFYPAFTLLDRHEFFLLPSAHQYGYQYYTFVLLLHRYAKVRDLNRMLRHLSHLSPIRCRVD